MEKKNFLVPLTLLASIPLYCLLPFTQNVLNISSVVLSLLLHLTLLFYQNGSYQPPMAILLPQLSQLLNSIQQLTASFFLTPTILWISLAAPSPGLCSFLITTAVSSSTRCPNWCAPGHSPDPHLLSHCTFTWHLICSQNFVVLTPQFICPALGSPLNI